MITDILDKPGATHSM